MPRNICILLLGLGLCAGAWAEEGPGQGQGETKNLEELIAACAQCHGADGISQTGQFPIIAGQYEAYLVHALEGYQQGRRKDPVMRSQVADLSERQIRLLARYYARQEGPLYVPKLP